MKGFFGTLFRFRKVRTRRSHRRRVSLLSRKEYALHKESARALVHGRLDFWNQRYGFAWKSVSIRNQKTRWGSCSKRGGLSFNYRLALLSPELADYVVVHELCHLEEFNHSKNFWMLVEKTIPDWRIRRAELKKIRLH